MLTDRSVDVLIIGAGQSALATAYFLRRAGVSMCLLDADPAPGVVSTAELADAVDAGIHLTEIARIYEELNEAALMSNVYPLRKSNIYPINTTHLYDNDEFEELAG